MSTKWYLTILPFFVLSHYVQLFYKEMGEGDKQVLNSINRHVDLLPHTHTSIINNKGVLSVLADLFSYLVIRTSM